MAVGGDFADGDFDHVACGIVLDRGGGSVEGGDLVALVVGAGLVDVS